MTPNTNMGRLYTDGASKTIVFGERYRNYRIDNGWGNVWGHGAWNMRFMAVFAYGNRDGATSYLQCNSLNHNNVGPNSKPQALPTGACARSPPGSTVTRGGRCAHPIRAKFRAISDGSSTVSTRVDVRLPPGASRTGRPTRGLVGKGGTPGSGSTGSQAIHGI
jgi:hypothetical protein